MVFGIICQCWIGLLMIGRYRSGFKTTSRGCLAPTALDAIQFYPSIHDPGAVFNEELTPIALGLVAKLGFLTFVLVNMLVNVHEI